MTPGEQPVTPPPEAVLIRLVRQAAGITVDAAATRAGISKARWTQVETGREKRKDGYRPAVAPSGTLARMAGAIPGVTPERLEDAGRPDAAEVLREIRRLDAPQPSVTVPPRPAELRYPGNLAKDAIAARVWEQNHDAQGEVFDDIAVLQGVVRFLWQQRQRATGARNGERTAAAG